MIKILINTVLLLILLGACNSNRNSSSDSASESDSTISSTTEKEKKISKRDLSITAENAYNDIFFDSIQMAKFFIDNKTEPKLIRRITSFYNVRNYQFAWFTKVGLTEQARGFWNLHSYSTTYGNDTSLVDKNLQKKMEGYTAVEDSFTVSPNDKNIVSTELMLTQHFITYTMNNAEDGYVKRKEMERFIPSKKSDPLRLADSLLSTKHKNNKYYEDINPVYKALKVELAKYVDIVKQGGYSDVAAPGKQYTAGKTGSSILALKKRLAVTGDMPADTTLDYNETLKTGIMKFQERFGYSPTGLLTDGQVKDLNVPALERIKQILINMDRMHWIVNEPKGQMIVVNIPEFILHVKEGKNKVFDMNVVVGKEGHNTMMFTGNLNTIVFSPYWNIPTSIIEKEILPAMQRNPNYLASHNMEQTGTSGGLPVVRQLPGGDNSLGKVKFLFPNSFNIYFHDTPAKSLFEKDKRAYSHGCIRLSDPPKLANYLLKDDASWPSDKIDEAMNAGVEQFVKVKKPVPVLITYYTAWVDDNGLLHFADDIYGHDKELSSKMFL